METSEYFLLQKYPLDYFWRCYDLLAAAEYDFLPVFGACAGVKNRGKLVICH